MPRLRPRLSAEPLEARDTPAWTGALPDHVALLPAAEPGRFRVLDLYDGSDVGDLRPFPDGFAGDVRTATGDVTGDGAPDLIVAAGAGGGPRVRVLDGVTGGVVRDSFALDPGFRGGVYVAAGDVNRDGHADLVVGAGEGGGPRVLVLDGRTGAPLADFFAYEAGFRGGVRVAAGDVDGDGTGPAEVVVGAGPGGGPRVAVFRIAPAGSPALPAEVASFLAYDPAFRGGVYVATAGAGKYAVSPDGGVRVGPAAKVVTGPGAGTAPVEKVFDGGGREHFAHPTGLPDARDGVRVTGAAFHYLVESGGVVGLSGLSSAGGWQIPVGMSRVSGAIAAVDSAAGTITLRTYRSDLLVVPVKGDARVSLFGPTPLSALRVGDLASAILGADGSAVEVSATPDGIPGRPDGPRPAA